MSVNPLASVGSSSSSPTKPIVPNPKIDRIRRALEAIFSEEEKSKEKEEAPKAGWIRKGVIGLGSWLLIKSKTSSTSPFESYGEAITPIVLPLLAKARSSKLYDALSKFERPSDLIKHILITALDNLAKAIPVNRNSQGIIVPPTFVDIIGFAIKITSEEFEKVQDSLFNIEKRIKEIQDKLLKLQEDGSKDFPEFEKLIKEKESCEKERQEIISRIFNPLIRVAFPNGAKDLNISWMASGAIWTKLMEDPAIFVSLYDTIMKFAQPCRTSSVPLFSFCHDAVTLFRRQLDQKEEKSKSEAEGKTDSEQDKKEALAVTPQQSLAERIAGNTRDFFINMHPKKDVYVGLLEELPEFTEYTNFWTTFSKDVQILIIDFAKSNDVHIAKMWRHVAASLEVIASTALQNLAGEIKESASSTIQLGFSLRNLGHVLAECYVNHRNVLNVDTATYERNKKELIAKVFKPLAIQLAIQTNLLQALKADEDSLKLNEKTPEWVKLFIRNLPDLLYSSYGSLISHQPHLRLWFHPEAELKAMHGEFEEKLKGEGDEKRQGESEEKVRMTTFGNAAITMSQAVSRMTLDNVVSSSIPGTPFAEGMTTAIINIMSTHFKEFSGQSRTFFTEMVHVVCNLATYSLASPAAAGLRQFASAHLEALLLHGFSKAKGTDTPLLPPTTIAAPQAGTSTPSPTVAPAPSPAVASSPSHWLSFLVSKCSISIEEFFKANAERLEKLYLSAPREKPPEDKELDACIGPLADRLILDLNMGGIPKLQAFNLNGVIRTQLIKYLYQFYVLLIQVQRGQATTHQRTMQLVHEAPKDEALQKMYEALGALDAQAQSEGKLSLEQAQKEKEARRKELLERIAEHQRRLATVTSPQVSAVEQLSQGVVAPVLRAKMQSFLSTSDKAVALLNAKLGMNCTPDVLEWFDGELKTLFSNPAIPAWRYIDYLLFATFQKILVNVIHSSETASRAIEIPEEVRKENAGIRRTDHDSVMGQSIDRHRRTASNVAHRRVLSSAAAAPLPPQGLQWESALVNLFDRVSKIVFRHFNKEEADKILREEREKRISIETDKRRLKELQAQIRRDLETERKEKSSVSEKQLKAMAEVVQTQEEVATEIHKRLVQQFYHSTAELVKEFGSDFASPHHPLYDLPLPQKLKKDLWDQVPHIVAEIAAKHYYQIYREDPQVSKDTPFSIFRSDHATGLCRILGIMVQDRTAELTHSNASESARNVFALMEGFMKASENHPVKVIFLSTINTHRDVIHRTMTANIEAISRKGMYDGAFDSRAIDIQHLLRHLGTLTESVLLKIMQKLSIRLKDLDDNAPNFMEEIIPTSALTVIATHINNTSNAVRGLRLRHLRDVGPPQLDRLKAAYGIANLHVALRPIVLTAEQTAGRTPQEVANLRRELEEKQRFDHLYRPLTERLLRLANLTPQDIIGGNQGLKILTESLGPKIVATVYAKLASPSLFHAVSKNVSDKMKGLCEGILAQQHSPDYRDRSSQSLTPQEIEAEEKENRSDTEWRDLFTQITNGLPGFLSTIMSIQDSSGTALKDIPVPNIRRATKLFFREWPLTRLINDMAFRPTLESMGPKGLRTTGQFSQDNPISFHLTQIAEALEPERDKKNNREKAQESLLAAKRVMLLGIRGNLARIPNAIFDPMERAATWVAKNIFCCVSGPVERILRELIKFIRNLIQFILYPLLRLFDYFLERYVSWQVPLTFQNIRHPINENLVIQLTFLFLDTAIEKLEEMEKGRKRETNHPALRTSIVSRPLPDPA